MPLRLTLKPGERVIVGGAVIRNGDGRSEFLIENETPVLREADILSPKAVRTACDRIYLALQLMYVDPQGFEHNDRAFRILVKEVGRAAPSFVPMLDEIVALVEENRLYQALKSTQVLLDREKELMKHVA